LDHQLFLLVQRLLEGAVAGGFGRVAGFLQGFFFILRDFGQPGKLLGRGLGSRALAL